jgi:hypothetical protein
LSFDRLVANAKNLIKFVMPPAKRALELLEKWTQPVRILKKRRSEKPNNDRHCAANKHGRIAGGLQSDILTHSAEAPDHAKSSGSNETTSDRENQD